MAYASQNQIDQFARANRAVADWIISRHRTDNFAASLLSQLQQKGALSHKQIAAVETCINRSHCKILRGD